MIYLSQLVGNPVLDVHGEKIGTVSDLGIATGEVFPRVTSLAFMGPGRTPFMISWKKYVDTYDEKDVHLKVEATDIRFSYLQPDEVLLARDILNKQIVDTRGMRVVRVNDLKLSDTNSTQLRLLGADVGAKGMIRSISPQLERVVSRIWKAVGRPLPERIIAWSYMDLVERDLSDVKLSVSHKTLDDMHPADIADIIERLDPRLRAQVFATLDDEQRADAMAELDDDAMAAELMGGMNESQAARILSEMDPDDAAELVSELDYEKAEKLLHLMGVKEERAIRQLLGYPEETAGRIMTSEFVCIPASSTVADAQAALRALDEDFEAVRYVYIHDEDGALVGAVSLSRLLVSEPDQVLEGLAAADLVVAHPEDDQESVALDIAKYNLLAMPVVDENRHMLGIVTVDDALDVLEEEHAEDMQIAGGGSAGDAGDDARTSPLIWFMRRNVWALLWAAVAAVLACWHGPLVAATLALPLALVLADDAVTFTTNRFLEDDNTSYASRSAHPSGTTGPLYAPILGYALVCIGLALVAGAVFALLAGAVQAGAPVLGTLTALVNAGVIAAGVSVVFSVLSMPAYLFTLIWREHHNLDSNGFALTLVALVLAVVVFVAVLAGLVLAGHVG